ncbi:zinc finger/helix-turn-helix protein [Gardnerella vaginalis JCP7672]|uniref:type II TA system antitoxin MqsA family protein n=1 Tax=Gardnerella vaginalis TaxID=2702 RepID=UPI00035283DA|nr:type II TA system antitoxin MqsA family protein [Gardnerella vaginalis]EPI50270.1 zinc finger/helix-turn-helix protein [Gardnerella vaginalis JCP7672]
MKDNKTFCEECRNNVEYSTKSVPMTASIKGKQYSYTGTEAHCKECDSAVYVPEIIDANLRALYDEYRKENNIIPLDKINEIPAKYSIGKRPLSLLLGWGEQTFSRFADGDIPSKQYSDILLRIYNDPKYYLQLLISNKDNLKSAISYEKSYKATQKLIRELQNNFANNNFDGNKSSDKINNVIQYLLIKCEDITTLALQKSLYYIQGFYFAFYKSFIFTDDCQAWIHGPVYKDVYLRYKDYTFTPIDSPTTEISGIKSSEKLADYKHVQKSDVTLFTAELTTTLSATEKAVCDSVIDNICCYSGKELERFTHHEEPWILTRGNLKTDDSSNKIISKKIIGEYFTKIKEKYNMINPDDIRQYAKDMFASK